MGLLEMAAWDTAPGEGSSRDVQQATLDGVGRERCAGHQKDCLLVEKSGKERGVLASVREDVLVFLAP
jgi:hypothetical protein